jgi:hypothetical protein
MRRTISTGHTVAQNQNAAILFDRGVFIWRSPAETCHARRHWNIMSYRAAAGISEFSQWS